MHAWTVNNTATRSRSRAAGGDAWQRRPRAGGAERWDPRGGTAAPRRQPALQHEGESPWEKRKCDDSTGKVRARRSSRSKRLPGGLQQPRPLAGQAQGPGLTRSPGVKGVRAPLGRWRSWPALARVRGSPRVALHLQPHRSTAGAAGRRSFCDAGWTRSRPRHPGRVEERSRAAPKHAAAPRCRG